VPLEDEPLLLLDDELRPRELPLDFDPREEPFEPDERELDPLRDAPDRDPLFEPDERELDPLRDAPDRDPLFEPDERELDPLRDEPERDPLFDPEALPRPERLDPPLARELGELEPELLPCCSSPPSSSSPLPSSFLATVTAAGTAIPTAAPATTFLPVDMPSSLAFSIFDLRS
jgi:hypothetical protein